MEGVPTTSGVRVLTLNLWGRQGAWNERRSVLTDGLRALQPDVVAFQEAIVGDGYDQVADLLGSGFHVVHQGVGLVGDDGNHGASIASRWPLGHVREADLHLTERTGDYPCAALVAEEEDRAHRVAWSAVEYKYEKNDQGNWVNKDS